MDFVFRPSVTCRKIGLLRRRESRLKSGSPIFDGGRAYHGAGLPGGGLGSDLFSSYLENRSDPSKPVTRRSL